MKAFTLRMDDELNKKAKIKAIEQDKTLQKYITDLIIRDLGEQKEENKK